MLFWCVSYTPVLRIRVNSAFSYLTLDLNVIGREPSLIPVTRTLPPFVSIWLKKGEGKAKGKRNKAFVKVGYSLWFNCWYFNQFWIILNNFKLLQPTEHLRWPTCSMILITSPSAKLSSSPDVAAYSYNAIHEDGIVLVKKSSFQNSRKMYTIGPAPGFWAWLGDPRTREFTVPWCLVLFLKNFFCEEILILSLLRVLKEVCMSTIINLEAHGWCSGFFFRFFFHWIVFFWWKTLKMPWFFHNRHNCFQLLLLTFCVFTL